MYLPNRDRSFGVEKGYVDMACARLGFVVVTDAPDEEAGGERIRVRRWV